MDTVKLLDECFVANNEYEINLIAQIIDYMYKDISNIYLKERSGNGYSSSRVVNLSNNVKTEVENYVQGFDDTNAGEILLFLSNLPKVSELICNDIEKQCEDISGIEQLSARDKVDMYMKEVFNAGYKALYDGVDEKQIGVNLYYQCEKFIDALVLEFKQNLLPMIDKENLVFDDILYYRRHLINLANNNENFSFVACEKCNRDDCTSYTVCSELPRVTNHQNLLKKYKKQIYLLDKKIEDGAISPEDYLSISTGDDWSLIKKLVNIEYPKDNSHKKVQFNGQHKIFSIISAERFEKILKRRYTGEAYEKDKDIYYMLSVGIDANEIFSGDNLLKKVNDIHLAYNEEENSK